MDEGLISVRYAKALFSLAEEKNRIPEVKHDMELILDACTQSADLKRLLGSPVVKPSDKISVLKLIFGSKINQLSMNFMELTVRNNREELLPAISRVILDFIRKEKNIKTAVITTAKPLDETTLRRAGKVLEKELGAQVELTARVDPGLIGGLVLRIDDRQYDATVKTRLFNLKQELLKAQL